MFCNLSYSDWINILGVIVNAFLAIYIVKKIQEKSTNKRYLKDYTINEVIKIRNDYRAFFDNLYLNQMESFDIMSWFKLMNIRINDLTEIINNYYYIENNIFDPYTIRLRYLFDNNDNYIRAFSNKEKIVLDENSGNTFIHFQQENINLFNKIIIHINEYD